MKNKRKGEDWESHRTIKQSQDE